MYFRPTPKKFKAPAVLVTPRSATELFEEFDMDTLALGQHAASKFWENVEKTEGCWNWTGWLDTHGYGTVHLDSKHYRAHRVSYEMHGHSLDPSMVIDHLCRNRKCVNPDHMEQVSSVENVMRGASGPALNAIKTHCKEGHELSGANLYVDMSCANPKRKCRTCMRAATKRYAERKKAARN